MEEGAIFVDFPDSRPNLEQQCRRSEAMGRLCDSVIQLPRGIRSAFVLRHIYEFDTKETAAALGITAHVYSTYESRSHPEDAKPTARGIKSLELLNSANCWYIVQVYWDSERPDNPIPDRYLHDSLR
jgi:hypothetical protein